MALGNLTYKTPNPVNQIGANLSNSEGCGVYLSALATIDLPAATDSIPYGVVVVGGDSVTPGTYPSLIAASAIEIVDAVGCVVQALAGTGGVTFNMEVGIETPSGAFVDASGLGAGDYVWGLALTDAAAGEQFLLRFNPRKL
jgi:hypothetical protein